MEHIIDTSTWAPLSVTDINDELADTEDILGALAEPALNDDSSLAEEMAATDYALSSKLDFIHLMSEQRQ